MSAETLPAVYTSLLGYDCSPRDERPACACLHLHYRCDPRLCQQAYSLSSTVKSFVAEPRWPVEFTFNVLAQASFRCPTCAVLHGGLTLPEIRAKWDTALNMNERTKWDYYERCIVKVLDDKGNVDIEDGSYTKHSFVFKVQDAAYLKSNCKVFSSATASVNESTGSYQSFKNLRAWITACASHPACSPMQPIELPSRVIDVFHNPQSSNIRLHQTHGEIGQYITLSHCWGQSVSLKTTKSNLTDMLRDIDWHLMPQTFLDAINIARNLHVRYLWIDALCIVQDDAKDWETETAKMGTIYANSLLTIAASHAADGRGGCFHAITAGAVRMRPIPSPSSSSRPSGITISDVVDRHDLFRTSGSSHPTRGQRDEPLLDRGWVLQERLLSPRVVHYTASELIWECTSTTRCQCNRARFDESRNLRIQLARHISSSSSSTAITRTVQLWLHLVEEYTQRRLTFQTDRLPAISGLAKHFAARGGLRVYLAGLWLEDLSLSLIWNQTPSATPQPHPTPPISRSSSKSSSRFSINLLKNPDNPSHIAPSWSWASVGGPISFLHSNPDLPAQQQPCITIHHAECKPSTVDPTGRVRSGTLKLTGQLLRIFELIPPDVPGGPAALRKKRGDGGLVYVPLDEREFNVPSRVCCLLWSVPIDNETGDAYFMVVAESKRVRGAMERIGMAKMAWKVELVGSGEYAAAEWFVGAEERVVVLV